MIDKLVLTVTTNFLYTTAWCSCSRNMDVPGSTADKHTKQNRLY